MRLEAFPRPPEDNGRGIHWSPSPYPPSGRMLDYWIEELHALHMRWVKVIDDGQGSSLPLCRRLIEEGFMPVVRLLRPPHPRLLNEQEKDTLRRLVDVGVRYLEIDHLPDLPSSWVEAMPANWFDVVMDTFIQEADFVLEIGGLPAIPAMTFHPDRNPVQAILARGRRDLFERGVWWAVHAYTLNRPLDYPDDEVNRTGRPVTPEEYARHHPWGWNEPPEIINRWRAEGRQPDARLVDDPHCFRVYELAGAWAQEALGYPIPVIATEGGAVTGWRDDRRYPRLDPWTAATWTERIITFLQQDAPAWFFAVCHWLLADRRMDISRPHAWESQCWYTHYWDKQFGFNGELPVVSRVKALPSRVRPDVETPAPPAAEPVVLGQPAEEAAMQTVGVIEGVVTDADHRPVADVEVALYQGDTRVAETRSDAEGRFRLEDIPAGTYALHVADRGAVDTVTVSGGDTTEVLLILEPRAEVAPPSPPEAPAPPEASREAAPAPEPAPAAEAPPSGRIVGEIPGGRPGATVVAVNERGDRWETTLDAEHRFVFENLPPGTYRLELVGVGVIRDNVALAPGEEVTVVFPMKGVVQGIVLGGTSETEVVLISDTYGWTRTVALSPQGQYRFTSLPPGVYRVRVDDHVLGPVTLTGEEVRTLEPLDLRPPHRAHVRGRVRNAAGDVLPDIPVRLLRRGQVVAETHTALNGTFAFEHLPPGEYQLVVEGEREVVRTVFLEQDRTLEVEVAIPPQEAAEVPPPPEAPPAEETEPVAEVPEAAPVAAPAEGPAIETYILLPPPDHPLTRAVVLAALPYLRREKVTAGFRVEEAERARQVLIVGSEAIYGPDVVQRLQTAGCEVDRVPEDPVTLVPMFRSL